MMMMSRNDETIKCSACIAAVGYDRGAFVFENEDRLLSHIATRHVLWIPFECVLCPMMCSTETVLKLHYDQAHMGMVPRAIYTYEEHKKLEMRRILTESRQVRFQNGAQPNDSGNFGAQHRPISITHGVAGNVNGCPTLSPNREHQQVIQSPFSFTSVVHNTPTPQFNGSANPTTATCQLTSTQATPNDVNSALTDIKQDLSDSDSVVLEEQPKLQPQEKSSTGNQQETEIDGASKSASKKKPKQVASASKKNQSKTKTISKGEKNPATNCQICRTDKLVSHHQREKHIWQKHMPRAAIQCRHCNWQYFSADAINRVRDQKRHVSVSHPEMVGVPFDEMFEDHRPKLMPKFKKLFGQAYLVEFLAKQPTSEQVLQTKKANAPKSEKAAIAKTSKKEENGNFVKLLCKLCIKPVPINHKTTHIWTNHMSGKRFTCDVCNYSAGWHTDLKKHADARHPEQRENCWTDNGVQMEDEFSAAFTTAFDTVYVPKRRRITNELPSADIGSPPLKKPAANKATKTAKNKSAASKLEPETKSRKRKREDSVDEAAVVHNTTKTPTTAEATPKPTRKTTWCNICQQHITMNAGTHVWIKHVAEKRFSCAFCPFGAALKGNLLKHVSSQHSGETGDELFTDNSERLFSSYRDAYREALGTHARETCRSSMLKTPMLLTADLEEEEEASDLAEISTNPVDIAVICRLCETPVSDPSLHIRQHHLTGTSECHMDGCTYMVDRVDVNAVQQHMEVAHPGVDSKVSTLSQPAVDTSDEFEQLMKKAFG